MLLNDADTLLEEKLGIARTQTQTQIQANARAHLHAHTHTHTHTHTGTVSKATVGKLPRDGVERIIMGFSDVINIPSSTELNTHTHARAHTHTFNHRTAANK